MPILPDLSRREDLVELMDTEELGEGELRETLDFLDTVDRLLGGRRLILGQLSRWLRGWPAGRPVSILDVGTGGADLPVALAAWGSRRGLEVRAVGLDGDRNIAALARRRAARAPGVEIVHSSLSEFARTGRRFDFVVTSLTLHHIPPAAQVQALRDLDALALRGVLISDLRRGLLGWLGAVALTALAGNRITRNDGPVSVQRSFTTAELEGLAAEAGLRYLRARAHYGFRLTLSGLKDG